MTTPVTPAISAGPIIDTHAHLFSASTPLAPGAWHAPVAEATAEQFLQAMDDHGINFGVLAAASIFGTNNTDRLDASRRHSRLRTTMIVEPDCSLHQMKAMAKTGAVGVRFHWRNVQNVPDLGRAGVPHAALQHRRTGMACAAS